VLKSILQKSVRRRRLLRAVRVAIELIGECWVTCYAGFPLSSRKILPVVIQEDSSLHPDFGLFVWLMITYSKDYVLPPQLIIRVLQIIFEVAFCQWSARRKKKDETMVEDRVQEHPCRRFSRG
jgi:hypothetical protein